MKSYNLLFISVILFVMGCENPIVTTPGTQGNNIVSGIYLTDEGGEIYSVWGNPSFPEKIEFEPEVMEGNGDEYVYNPRYFELHTPYPNPADGNMSISVSFPRIFEVKVWLETASLSINQSKISNGVYSPQGIQKFILYEDKIPKPGYYNFQLDKRTKCNGGELNQGFFRVFVQVDGKHTLWQDVYVGGVREEAPPALRNVISAYPCSPYQ